MKKITKHAFLLSTAALLCGCGDVSDSDSNETTQTSITLPDNLQAPIYVSHPSNIHNQGEKFELLDAEHITTHAAIRSSLNNKQHMGDQTFSAHRLAHTSDMETLPQASEDQAIFFDMFGHHATHHPRSRGEINQAGKVTGLYLKKSQVLMESGGRMDTLVTRADDTEIVTNDYAPFTAHSFFLDEKSSVTGNDEIRYVNSTKVPFGMTFQGVTESRPSLYDETNVFSAKKGDFVIKGRMNKQTISPGMTLKAYGSKTYISELNHSGGTLVLKASSHLETNSYTVNAPSKLEFIWDTSVDRPRMIVNGPLRMYENVGLVLTANIRNLTEGKIATLIQFDSGSAAGFKKEHGRFGADFEIISDSNTLSIRLLRKGTTTATIEGLSNSSVSLAKRILASNSEAASQLALAEIHDAHSALSASSSEANLPAETNWSLPNFAELNKNTTTHNNTWSQHHKTGASALHAMGVTLSDSTQIGLSLLSNIETQSPTAGVHCLKNNHTATIFGDNSSIGLQLNQSMGIFDLGVTHQISLRSGTIKTNLWDLQISNAVQHRTNAYLGVNLKLPQHVGNTVQLGARILVDLHKSLNNHTAYINELPFKINGQSLNRNVGLQLNAAFPFSSGYLSFSYDSYATSQQLNSTISLTFALHD